MSNSKRTVLISGCTDGSLGAALAIEFHNAGLHVYATARNPSKMKHLEALGIETLTLDVLSNESIAAIVSKLSSLDILVNNAGATYLMPLADTSIPEAKKLYDLNVWAPLAVTQAFLPLLLKSKGMIVNHTSTAAVVTIPFSATYNSSKAALMMISDTLRMELEPFGVKAVELRSSLVKSNGTQTVPDKPSILPNGSIYEPARETVERCLRHEQLVGQGMKAEKWAKAVVADLLKKDPPPVIWRGESSFLAWLITLLPVGTFDGTIKKMFGMDIVERVIGKQR